MLLDILDEMGAMIGSSMKFGCIQRFWVHRPADSGRMSKTAKTAVVFHNLSSIDHIMLLLVYERLEYVSKPGEWVGLAHVITVQDYEHPDMNRLLMPATE